MWEGPSVTFSLDDSQIEAMLAWKAEHDKTCPFADRLKQGAAGGRFTYEFTPTSLGMVTKVVCGCGGVHDMSDWDW